MNLDDVHRLEELARRRAQDPKRPLPEPRVAPVAPASQSTASTDPKQAALAARLELLAQRRTGSSTGNQGSASSPSGSAAANRSKRRHPAQGARAAALGLSIVSTGGLAALFAVSNPSTGTQLAAASIVSGQTAASAAVGSQTATPAAASAAPAATPQAAAPVVGAAPTAAAPTAPVAPTPDPASQQVNIAVPAPAPVETTVQGAVFQNKWGNVQVEVTFGADGSLIDVSTLQTPYRDGKSVRINDYAVPRLNSEALSAQSANVDTVSGATYTSNDYRRSLQSAIDTARAAGVTAVA